MKADRIFAPRRSEVWLADFGHIQMGEGGEVLYTRHREHGGKRPCVILSFNRGPAELAIVVPITKDDKRIATHVAIEPPEGGLRVPSFIICEGIRSIARQFLIQKWGQVEDSTIR